jgi:precorrin-2 dehydrogenase/sirohydrochlorin ferrochelatase
MTEAMAPSGSAMYPVLVVLDGKRCLVVGGGQVAARKASGLLAAGAYVAVIATELSPALHELASAPATGGRLSLHERPYRRGDAEGYWLVIAATGDRAVNRTVYEDGEAAGVWVNSADDPASSSFILPAIARQGPVTLAVSTTGYSPALASWLRSELAARIGPEVAVLAEMLAGARAQVRAAGRSTEEVDWRPALDWDMLDLIRSGRRAEAKERLEACLSLPSG